MTYPSGVQTATLAFSNPGTFTGASADSVTMTVASTASVVWQSTGEPIDNFTEVTTPGPGLPGSLTVPLVDQAGFIDGTGNAFSMWAYQLTRRASFGGQVKVVTKNWQPIAGQTTIDFDDLPGGPIGLPVSVPASPVTSVAGLTGAVDGAALAGVLPLDAATAANINTPASATATALNATLVPANPTLTVTYNPDGSVATTTEDGVLTSFTYNGDGTVNTQTRAGTTKTYTYDANGNVTGAA